ncbi:gibberellin 2-beta-dioxygenase 6 isoform X2 [Eucalyptus grandis]|uniref:gibberellin 2-beta-dioxygenase 6 isoform X2 n=1 Tax=Eucalyptus grandis TaxID=71139 RepID=UPI00192EB642|nr:gibberellin 2-beta-dioxygenase 6 isoform X2 [Eucalyptus grandis]
MELQSSYPPPFRRPSGPAPAVDPDEGSRTTNQIQEQDPIPVVDLQRLDVEGERLGEACRAWGIFRVVNHGVPLDLLTRLRDRARRLFALPFESKQALLVAPLSYFWGTPVLTPSGSALLGGAQGVNWVEGLNVPLAQLSLLGDGGGGGGGGGDDDDEVVTAVASLRNLLQEYGVHLARIAKLLFQAMAEDLRLDPAHSKSYLSESTGFVRLYRYPHCSKASSDMSGMEAHSDSSVLSILCQDEVGGLELYKDEQWIQVQPVPDALIVNAMSDDEYISVKHRVKVKKPQDRTSVCYFVFPGQDSVIRSSKYRPFTYGDFQSQVQQDVKTLGFKVGLPRFKLD